MSCCFLYIQSTLLERVANLLSLLNRRTWEQLVTVGYDRRNILQVSAFNNGESGFNSGERAWRTTNDQSVQFSDTLSIKNSFISFQEHEMVSHAMMTIIKSEYQLECFFQVGVWACFIIISSLFGDRQIWLEPKLLAAYKNPPLESMFLFSCISEHVTTTVWLNDWLKKSNKSQKSRHI